MFIIDPNQPYSSSCASVVAKLRGRPTQQNLDIAEALETIQNALDQINRALRREIEVLDGAAGAPGTPGQPQTPWEQNIDGDGYDLTNVHDMETDFLDVANHILCPHIYCTSASPGSGDEGFAPRIAFKWDGMATVNSLVGMDSTGVIRTWSDETAAAAYMPFAASRLMSKSGGVNFLGLPTSTAGLVTGDLWIDTAAGNVLKVVP